MLICIYLKPCCQEILGEKLLWETLEITWLCEILQQIFLPTDSGPDSNEEQQTYGYSHETEQNKP